MNDHTTPDTRSSDLLVGDLFRRLYLMRDLSEVTFRAAIEGALVALGRAALEEAEARGRRVAERTGARPTSASPPGASAARPKAPTFPKAEPSRPKDIPMPALSIPRAAGRPKRPPRDRPPTPIDTLSKG